MNPIPSFARSSIDENSVSLTVMSIGKAGVWLITFAGAVGLIDPAIASQPWGNFVGAVAAAIPAGFAVYHTGQVLWGIVQKIAVRIFVTRSV